jgi:DNA transformation protein
MLADAGFASPDALRAADPFEVYARVKRVHPRASLNLLYALIGAIEGRDWREVARNDRTTLLLRLDQMGLAP